MSRIGLLMLFALCYGCSGGDEFTSPPAPPEPQSTTLGTISQTVGGGTAEAIETTPLSSPLGAGGARATGGATSINSATGGAASQSGSVAATGGAAATAKNTGEPYGPCAATGPLCNYANAACVNNTCLFQDGTINGQCYPGAQCQTGLVCSTQNTCIMPAVACTQNTSSAAAAFCRNAAFIFNYDATSCPTAPQAGCQHLWQTGVGDFWCCA